MDMDLVHIVLAELIRLAEHWRVDQIWPPITGILFACTLLLSSFRLRRPFKQHAATRDHSTADVRCLGSYKCRADYLLAISKPFCEKGSSGTRI